MAKPDLAGWRLAALVSGLTPMPFLLIAMSVCGEEKPPQWLWVCYISLLVFAGVVAATLAYKMGRRGWLWFIACVFWGLAAAVLAFFESKVIVSSLPRWRKHKLPSPQPRRKPAPKSVPCDFCRRFAATRVTWYEAYQEKDKDAYDIYRGLGCGLALVACPRCHDKLVWQRFWFKAKRTFLAVRIMVYVGLIVMCIHGMRSLGLPPLDIAIAFLIIPIVEGVALAKKFDKTQLREPEVAKAKAKSHGLTLRGEEGSDFFPITGDFAEVCNDWLDDQRESCVFCGQAPDIIKQVELCSGATPTTLFLGVCYACRRHKVWHHLSRLLFTLGSSALLAGAGMTLAFYYYCYNMEWTKAFTMGLVIAGCLITILVTGLKSFFDPYYLVRATPVLQRYAAYGYEISECIELRAE